MRYIELKVHATSQGIEMVSRLFMSYGIDRVSINDPADLEVIMNKEHEYTWDYVDEKLKQEADREPTISAWLEDTEENRKLVQEIKLELMKLKAEEQYYTFGENADFGRLYAESEYHDDVEWKDKWKENFKPAKITERIVVKPTWEEYNAKADELVLEIDPGMAFGTGTHETTSLCMKLIEKYCCNYENTRVLDVGCGSGILSIAAALLGCRYVLGTEIDDDAVSIAEENVKLNGVDGNVKIMHADLTKGVNYRVDILVANLMHDLIIRLAPDAVRHLDADGIFISSGILIEKKEQVSGAILDAGFEIVEILEDGEWCAIAARRKQSA